MHPRFAHMSRTIAALTLAGTALAVAACSSGSSGTSTPAVSVPTASPTVAPTSAPTVAPTTPPTAAPSPTALPPVATTRGAACAAGSAPVTATVTFQTGVVTMPSIGGCGSSLTFANVVTPVTATVTAQLSAPAGFGPAPAAPSGFTGQSATPVFYYTFKLSAPLVITVATPVQAFTVPTAPSSGSFYNVSVDAGPASSGSIGGGAPSYGGPATVSGNVITFPANNGGGNGGGTGATSLTLLANENYIIGLFYF